MIQLTLTQVFFSGYEMFVPVGFVGLLCSDVKVPLKSLRATDVMDLLSGTSVFLFPHRNDNCDYIMDVIDSA